MVFRCLRVMRANCGPIAVQCPASHCSNIRALCPSPRGWDIWRGSKRRQGNSHTFKERSIVARFINLRDPTEVRARPPARSLARSRKSTFINHFTENLEIPPSKRAKRFHVSQFPMAVGRACTACRECSQFVGIFSSVLLSMHTASALCGCSNCRPDPGHLFSALSSCRPWFLPPEITACPKAVSHE